MAMIDQGKPEIGLVARASFRYDRLNQFGFRQTELDNPFEVDSEEYNEHLKHLIDLDNLGRKQVIDGNDALRQGYFG